MATTTTITKMLFRRGNDADRQQTILASGEPGWCLDTNRLWIGDGVTPGGYPALSAVDVHLQYEPVGQNAPQALNINIPGLVRTLTDQHGAGNADSELLDQSVVDPNDPDATEAGKYVYPANQDLKTFHDIRFMRKTLVNAGNPGLIMGANNDEGDTSLKIDCPVGQKIDIGDGAFVLNKETSDKTTVSLDLDTITFKATQQIFDNGTDTHFEDKSIDLNVVYEDATAADKIPNEGSNGASSEHAGVYITHDNWLSAGYMRIAPGVGDYEGATWELAPTVYKSNWESKSSDSTARIRAERGYVEFEPGTTDRYLTTRNSNSTNWIGKHTLIDYFGNEKVGNNAKGPKHISIMSPRPGGDDTDALGYEGYAHLVLEAGLISYGPGDPSTHGPDGYNAYLINQSVDTASHPTFSGLTIRSGGAPIPVASGGTGVNSFTANSVLHTSTAGGGDDLDATILAPCEFPVGTSGGVNKTTLSNGQYIEVVKNNSTGKMTINNLFSPDRFSETDKKLYMHKWYKVDANSGGEFIPTAFQSGLSIHGVAQSIVAGSDTNRYIYTSTAGNTLQITHDASTATDTLYGKISENGGDYLYADTFTNLIDASEDNSTTDTITPTNMQDTGLVVGALKINSMGHLENIRSKDLDTRYARLLNMGDQTRRQSGIINAPADENEDDNTDAVTIPARQTRTHFSDPVIPASTGYCAVPVGIKFNDYGTIHRIDKANLSDYYLDKSQTYAMIKALASGLNDNIAERKSNDVDIADLYSKVTKGAEKVALYNSEVNSDDNWRAVVFAKGLGNIVGGGKYYTTLGIDQGTSVLENRIMYNPKHGTLQVSNIHARADVTAQTFHGDGNGLTNLADVVSQSLGGQFNGPITIANAGGTMEFQTKSSYNKMEWTSPNGGFIDFKNSSSDDYDGRFHYTQPAGQYTGGQAFRFILNGQNTATTSYLHQHDEMLKIGTDGTHIAKRINVGGPGNFFSRNSTDTAEGAQLNLNDAGQQHAGESKSIGGVDTTISWSIDNFTDLAGNGGYYKLGTGAKLLRFFRRNGGWVAISNAGDVKAKGDIIAFGTSDKRLKKKLKPIKDPLEKISMIGGYTFEWDKKKTSARSGNDVGVVAQEIEKILPEIVETRDDELKTKAVRYDKLVPLLIEGIKELTQKVESLEAQLETK